MIQTLKKTRAMLATSWAGPGSWQCRGNVPGVRLNASYSSIDDRLWLPTNTGPCDWSDEGVTHFTVDGALRAASGYEDITETWDALEHVFGGDVADFRMWLLDPALKLGDLLAIFDKAILRAGRDA